MHVILALTFSIKCGIALLALGGAIFWNARRTQKNMEAAASMVPDLIGHGNGRVSGEYLRLALKEKGVSLSRRSFNSVIVNLVRSNRVRRHDMSPASGTCGENRYSFSLPI